MPRSVNSVASRARRKKILSKTRGNFLSRKNVWTVAKNTYEKGLTYSQLMGRLAKQNIGLNRKVLADLAMNNPEAFRAIVNSVK